MTPLRTWIDAQPKPGAIDKLAEDSGVSLRALYRYANGGRGHRYPPPALARKIAAATGIPMRDLLGPDDLAAFAAVTESAAE